MRPQVSATGIGARLAESRGPLSQKAHAEALGVALRSYQGYERGEAEPSLQVLRGLVAQGWSAHWLLTGEGPERLNSEVGHAASQPVGLTPGNVKVAAEAVAAALEVYELEEVPPSVIAGAVLALATWLDAQSAAKHSVADLLKRARAYINAGMTPDGRPQQRL